MKYTNLFLAFCLTASAWTGLSAADDAAAKAKAEAEAAKKKAYQELCRENQTKFNTLRDQLVKLGNEKNFADMDQPAEQLLALYGKDGVTKNQRDFYNLTVGILNRDKKANAALLKKYLEKFVKMTDGDTKVDYITELANLLKEQKLMKPDEINAVLAIRVKVPGISDGKLFALALEEADLKKADGIAQKMLADPALKSKTELLSRQIIPAFLKLEVYGSDYANKYYKLLLEAETNPDGKARVITDHAAFLKKYAIVSDEEADKLLATRCTLAISPDLKAEFQIAELDRCETQAQFKEQFEKLYASFKDSPKSRLKLIERLNLAWHARGFRANGSWITPFMENVAIQDAELMKLSADRVLSVYRAKCVLDRHDAAIAFARKKYEPLKGAMTGMAPAHIATVKAVQEVTAKLQAKQAVQRELNNAIRTEKDPAAKEKLAAQITEVNREAGSLNEQLLKLREYLKEDNLKWEPKFREFQQWNNHLYSIYSDISRRYYDKPNPYCLQQMIQLDADMQMMLGWTDMHRYNRMTENARTAGDFKTAEALYRRAVELKKQDPKVDIFDVTVAYAGTLYDQEEYEKALELTVPLLDAKRHEHQKYELYNIVGHSYIAIRNYEAAVPVMEKWIALNRDYMQKRYNVQIKDLKKRAEMQKAKAAK